MAAILLLKIDRDIQVPPSPTSFFSVSDPNRLKKISPALRISMVLEHFLIFLAMPDMTAIQAPRL